MQLALWIRLLYGRICDFSFGKKYSASHLLWSAHNSSHLFPCDHTLYHFWSCRPEALPAQDPGLFHFYIPF